MDTIELLIQETKTELERAQNEHYRLAKEKEETTYRDSLEAMKTAFGGLWGDFVGALERYSSYHVSANEIDFRFWFGAQRDRQLRPFVIQVTRGRVRASLELTSKDYPIPVDFGVFLVELREHYAEWEERDRKAQISNLLQDGMRVSDPNITIEDALETLEILKIEYPNDGVWDEEFENFRSDRIRQANEAAAELLYRNEITEYKAQHDLVLERNQARLGEIQERINVISVEYWKLTYAMIGEEDLVHTVEVGTDLVLAENPDKRSYWPVVLHGHVTDKRYFNPVSIEGPLYMTLDQNNWEFQNHYWVDEAQQRLDYLLNTILPAEEVKGMDPLPARPRKSALLEESVTRYIDFEILE